jgi:hypothetical protein
MKTSNKSPDKSPNKQMDRLKNRMSAAYHSRSDDAKPTDPLWQQNVMRSVRRIGPHGRDNRDRVRSGQLAWRLVPAALVLMIIMAVMIIRVDDSIEYQMASLAVSDPVQSYMTYKPF